MPAIELSSGPARVIDSGSVTCFFGHELEFRLGAPFGVAVELAFATDEDRPDVGVEVTTFADRFRIRCENFDGVEGRGSSEPVFIGEFGDRLLFFHFRVFRYGRTEDRTVHYTFFDVAKEAVGYEPR